MISILILLLRVMNDLFSSMNPVVGIYSVTKISPTEPDSTKYVLYEIHEDKLRFFLTMEIWEVGQLLGGN